jgi:hypothetical protein
MKNVLFILFLFLVTYTHSAKNFMRSSSSKVIIIQLSKSKSSAFSLVGTKEDESDAETPNEKTELESLTKKLV